MQRYAADAKRDGSVPPFEYRTWPGSGAPRSVAITTEPLLVGDTRVGVVGTLQDVTDRRATVDLLFRREEEFRAIVEAAPDLIVRYDRQRIHVYVSPAIERILGIKPDEVLGKNLLDAGFSRSMCEAVAAGITRVFETGREADVEFQCGGRALHGRVVPQRVKGGQPEYALGVFRDVTERNATLDELRRSERRYRQLLERSPDGIFKLDLQGCVTSVNPALVESGGWVSEAEILGRPFTDFLHPDDVPAALRDLEGAMRGEAATVAEYQLLTKSGDVVLMETLLSTVIEDGEINGVFGIARDITMRRRTEKELALARNLAALGQMAATVAHEFNNVLMSIQPFAEIVSRNAPDNAQRRPAEQILDAVRRGRRITEEVLRFARPAEPVRKPIALATLISGIGTQLEVAMPPHISVRIDPAPAGVVIDGDAEQVAQVILNLANNARDAMTDGGSLSISMAPFFEHPRGPELPSSRDYVEIVVSDTGCGIPAALAEKIFEPFFTTKRRGTGLGLALSHQIVTAHGGYIFVASREGGGTEMHVVLPTSEEAEVHESAPVGVSSGSIRDLAGYVLLVDDEEAILEGVAELLMLDGLECRCVADGTTAIAVARNCRPAVVVLDIGLPDLPGTAVFEALRSSYPDLPVIFATGHGDEQRLAPYLAQPGVALLRKPYQIAVLENVLKSVAQEKQRQLVQT